MQTLSEWLAALAIVVAAGLAWQLDPAEDHSFEVAQAAELEAAARQADKAERREAAARAVCAAHGSVNTVHAWQEDGSLVCRTRRGRTVEVIAAGML